MDKKSDEYAGPGTVVTAFGQSQVDSLIGSIAGAAAGAAVGALSHDEKKMRKAGGRRGAHNASHTLDPDDWWKRGEQPFSYRPSRHTRRMKSEGGVFGEAWHNLSRGSKMFWGALVGATIIGTIAQFAGYFRGAKKASNAKQQYNDLASENFMLTQRLEVAEAALAEHTQKSFSSALEKERSEADQLRTRS